MPDSVASGERCGKPVATTLTTTSSALIQLCLTSSGKCSGPRALSRKATSTTVKFCFKRTSALIYNPLEMGDWILNDERTAPILYPKMGDLDVVPTVALTKVFQFVHKLRYIIKRIDYHSDGVHDVHRVHLRNIHISRFWINKQIKSNFIFTWNALFSASLSAGTLVNFLNFAW